MSEEKLTEEIIREAIKRSETNGVYFTNIPNDTYHQGPGISSSDLKMLINETIGKFLYKKNNPRKESQAFRLGSMIHMKLLEEDLFKETYSYEYPDIPARRGETKKIFLAWSELYEEILVKTYGGKLTSEQWKIEFLKWKYPKTEFISEAEIAVVDGIAENIKNHPAISKFFKDSIREASLYWIDEQTDILCKCRPDILNLKFPCIADPKSCQNAGLDEFEGDVTKRDYHLSASFYLEGAKHVFGKDLEDFIYIPCEKEPPYQVAYYPADEGSLTMGEGLYRAGLIIYKNYLDKFKQDKETWIGHSMVPKPVGIRPYAFNKLSQVIAKHDLHDQGLEKYIR